MSPCTLELQHAVDRFTQDLTALAQQLARQTLQDVVRKRTASRATGQIAPRRLRTSSSQRAAEGARAISYLLAHPGASAAQLRRHLAVTHEHLRALIIYLRTRRLVRSSGRTRASRYYATARATTRKGSRAT